MKKLPIYQIDAFTNRPFAGNPAAVMPLEEWLPPEMMQRIAAENNLAETAFFVKTPGGDADYHLRWFTPAMEIELCGHATLASAFVIFTELNRELDRVRFSTEKAGPLAVTRKGDRLSLDFPARAPKAAQPDEALAAAMGAAPTEWLTFGNKHFLLYPDEATVARLQPDMRALRQQFDGYGVIATARGEGEVDFVSRFFAPGLGVDEDPVTGSAHCLLIPYWAEKLGKEAMFARQISARGGDLWCRLDGERVEITGQCVEVIRGTFSV
ncbi:PhzF family phenazine biosynthesis protein [Pedomonas mirosovicensis]|uniref:PhzF family phenazine biosynthesis protein n=1 Tax=Pedomonas mirosovicensis TaxID=2908641 RepID=UPI002169FDCF|nr:PhzF family phenazine biosynthesis protein [Pedomonas mirosovicensis]MCH8684918.1 PhzF family phenazine biosynthesis protein [Pedomonas mirosovicensis]